MVHSSLSKDVLWARFFTAAPRRQESGVERYNNSQESLRALARRHGINPKTVAKWKRRLSVADLRTGPREPKP